MKITVNEVAGLVEGRVVQGPAERELDGIGSLEQATETDLSFFGNSKYEKSFRESQAGGILVPPGLNVTNEKAALIEVENPTRVFDRLIQRFGAPEVPFEPGIHPSAVVADDVKLDPEKVCVGPLAVIESGAVVGDGSWIGPHVVVSRGAMIGRDCHIYSLVSIREGCILGDRVIVHSGAVIGSDGYGFEFVDGHHQKIRQAGIVEIGDDVEIGSNTTIDRARFGATVIGEGTKIDNLVQIAHNVKIGKHCLIVGQAGISGSAELGEYVTLAAKSGVAGHLKIGDRVTVAGKAGVIKSLDDEGVYMGYPAKPMKEWSRLQMYQKRIPSLISRIEELEKRLGEQGAP